MKKLFAPYIAALPALLTACGGGGGGNPNGPGPVTPGNVRGRVESLYGGDVVPFTVQTDPDHSYNSNDGSFVLQDLMPGVYNFVAQGPGVKYRREHSADTRQGDVNFDAIPSDYSFNMPHFQQMCLGIETPNPGGASLNEGTNKRYRPGVPIVFHILTNYSNGAVPEGALRNAEAAVSNIAAAFNGTVNISSSRVDSEPSNPPEGAIVVRYRQGSSHGGPATFRDGYVQTGGVFMGILSNGVYADVNGHTHEFLHAVGPFDHTTNGIMSQGSPKPDIDINETDCMKWKYRRNLNATLVNGLDKD